MTHMRMFTLSPTYQNLVKKIFKIYLFDAVYCFFSIINQNEVKLMWTIWFEISFIVEKDKEETNGCREQNKMEETTCCGET